MNFSCIFLLALALTGASAQAYISSGGLGYGAVGTFGYNGLCGTSCGNSYGAGCGTGYDTVAGYGCRGSCAPVCGSAAVCDACQCMKTIVRPNVVERIPYSCARRVQSSTCRSCGLYSGGVYGDASVGAIGGGCSGYLSGGYLY